MNTEYVSTKEFLQHIQTQARSNQDTAVALTKIESMTKEILEQTKHTTKRVATLENDMNDVKPKVDDLIKRQAERRELKKKMTWFWIERAFYFGLLLVGIILELTGNINVFK